MLSLLDGDLAARLFADLLPDHGPVASVRALTGGSVTGAYRVSFADPAAPEVVAKVSPAWEAWTVRKEANAYRLLELHGIGPIPRVLVDSGRLDLLDGGACIVLSLLPGMNLGEISRDLVPTQLREVYRQLGALLARIHAVPRPEFGYIFADTDVIDPSPDNASHMAGMFARNLREYRELGGDPVLADAVAELAAAHAATFAACTAPVLCHGDFHENNVLVVEGPDGAWTISGLIDPANMHAGDPLVDLVRTDAFSVAGDPGKLAGLLAGYGPGGDQWPAAWEPRMRLYRALLALELRNWFTTRAPESVQSLDEELRELAAPRTPRRV